MTRNQLKEGVKDQEELRVSVQEKGKSYSLVKTINCKSKKKRRMEKIKNEEKRMDRRIGTLERERERKAKRHRQR